MLPINADQIGTNGHGDINEESNHITNELTVFVFHELRRENNLKIIGLHHCIDLISFHMSTV